MKGRRVLPRKYAQPAQAFPAYASSAFAEPPSKDLKLRRSPNFQATESSRYVPDEQFLPPADLCIPDI